MPLRVSGPFSPPTPAWEASVRRAGSCLVALGCGLGVTDDSFIVVPEGTAFFVATCGGSFPAPSLDDIPGLHVLPLTTDAYDPLAQSSFVIDSDVLIEIERFCVTPSCEGDRVERIRHLLLLNIAYRDLLPALALAQVHQPGRRSTNVDTATCAAKAVHEVIDWDRARISTHDPPCQSFRPGFLEDFTGTASDARMLALYAGVLRLRRL